MSTSSEAWEQMDPGIRDFYRNHSLHFMNNCRPYFNGFYWYWHLDVGIDLLRWNIQWQQWLFGKWDKNIVLLFEDEPILYMPWALPMGVFGYMTSFNQWKSVPEYAENYPRPKYKVRKHYWTGKPRRRMNYTGP